MSVEFVKSQLTGRVFIAEALKGQTVVLGDQSPWAGGLLREHVLRTQLGAETLYFLQDLDTPWFETSEKLAIKAGWNAYWSLACRYPWSFCVPGFSLPELLSLTPRGLSYLIGPRTSETIASQNNCPDLLALLKQMLYAEWAWARRLADWGGFASDMAFDLNADSIKGLVESFQAASGLSRVECFSDWFKNSKPLLYGQLPEDCFWHISKDGSRSAQAALNTYPVPRGKTLPLEFAARGWILACTHLPYIEQTLALRDRYLQALPIRLLYVHFDWQARFNPLQAAIDEYNCKRLRRGKPEWPGGIVSLNRIEAYWRARPSSISHGVLGCDLNPRFEWAEL